MTVPAEYESASQDFERLLLDARDEAGLTTTNQSYTMVQGVLQVFRSRLSPSEAIRFANALPPLTCALFVTDWDLDEPVRSFGDRAAMTAEVHTVRPEHNFAPATAIHDVAVALRKQFVDSEEFEAVLVSLPPGATDFWSV